MDRKSGKKIVSCTALWFVCVILATFGGGLLIKSAIDNHEKQLTEIITIHPELKQEMVQNFMFYQQQILDDVFSLWILLLILFGGVVFIFYFIGQAQQRKEEKRILEDVDTICSQLEQFCRGNFEMISYFSGGDGNNREKCLVNARIKKMNLPAKIRKKSECDFGKERQWDRIWELLRELAYYFSDMKEKQEAEENSTKALITDISHQLKTPLASLRVSHELTEAENLTGDERREFSKKEEQEIEKLEILLNELINLSRLENHMIQIKPEYLEIKQTITEAVNQTFMKAHIKNMEIRVNLAKDVVIKHDRKWTVEALANVLDNAIKYSEPETCIEIRVRCLPSNLLIEIEDEGIGIAEEDLHRIFKRFYRGKIASGYAKEGAGVGLYLTRNILEQQGGSIVAKRKMEQGTIFKITLPLA